VALRHLPDGGLHDQPRFGEGRLQGALPRLAMRLSGTPRASTEGPGPETPALLRVLGTEDASF
jgi:hypothetical protein